MFYLIIHAASLQWRCPDVRNNMEGIGFRFSLPCLPIAENWSIIDQPNYQINDQKRIQNPEFTSALPESRHATRVKCQPR